MSKRKEEAKETRAPEVDSARRELALSLLASIGATSLLAGCSTPTKSGAVAVAKSLPPEHERSNDRAFRNVKWSGAVGDGKADDTAAIQAALDACLDQNHGVELHFPNGIYRITATLKVGRTINGVESISISGANTSRSSRPATQFMWDGAASDSPMWLLSGSDFEVKNLFFNVSGGRRTFSAIEIGAPSTDFVSVTHIAIRGCQFNPGHGEMDYGVTVGAAHPVFGNLENMVFEDSGFGNQTQAGVWIASGQPFNTVFNRCAFGNFRGNKQPYGCGIKVTTPTAQIVCYSPEFQNLERAIVVTETCPILIIQADSEHCKRLLERASISPAGCAPVVLIGGRYSTSSLELASAGPNPIPASDQNYVMHRDGSPLVMIGVSFGTTYRVQPGFRIRGVYDKPIVSIGNAFPNSLPFYRDSVTGSNVAGIYSFGDRGVFAEEPVVRSLPMLSGSETSQGLFTISGASKTATIIISGHDTSYNILATVQRVEGKPPPGAMVAYVASKAPPTCTMAVPVEPGVGASVTYYWRLFR